MPLNCHKRERPVGQRSNTGEIAHGKFLDTGLRGRNKLMRKDKNIKKRNPAPTLLLKTE